MNGKCAFQLQIEVLLKSRAKAELKLVCCRVGITAVLLLGLYWEGVVFSWLGDQDLQAKLCRAFPCLVCSPLSALVGALCVGWSPAF